MSKTTKTTPAFPVFPESHAAHEAAFRGMSLRDYFAAAALQGLAAKHGVVVLSEEDAHDCYRVSDLMLEERAKVEEDL